MKTLYQEPLVHFLVLGACLFAVYGWVGGNSLRDTESRIVVTDDDLRWLERGFLRQWNRAPTPLELEHLVEEHVREEVYYREALALGLDADDTIIRRRLVQKMHFLSEDLAAQEAPSAAQLRRFFRTHIEDYRVPPRMTFTHVYFSPDQRGDRAAVDAERALRELRATPASTSRAGARGDRFLPGHRFTSVTPGEVERLFGPGFGEAVVALDTGSWLGPIESGYGWHLVRVEAHQAGRLPTLDDARAAVVRDFERVRRQEMNDRFYKTLRDRYAVEIVRSAHDQ